MSLFRLKSSPLLARTLTLAGAGALLLGGIVALPRTAHADKGPMWVARYNNPYGSSDDAYAIVTDARGNIFVGGIFRDQSGDNLSVAKYDANGIKLWQAVTQNASLSGRVYLALDKSNNIFLGGTTSTGNSDDYTLIKYSTAGAKLWTAIYNDVNNSTDVLTGIAVDLNGNAYMTGYGFAQASAGDYDAITLKYNASGVKQWAKIFGLATGKDDYTAGIAVAPSGNYVYITSASRNAADTYNWATVGYTSAGSVAWQKVYADPDAGGDKPAAIATDSQGNVIVSGYGYSANTSNDFVTIKYAGTTGAPQWTSTYDGGFSSSDYANALVIDSIGNVYVTGNSAGDHADDFVTVKYNGSGAQVWATRTDGPGHDSDIPHAIGVDAKGDVFVTGESYNGSTNQIDYLTVKYNNLGGQVWQSLYNGPGGGDPANPSAYDFPTAIAVDSLGNATVTGYSTGLNGSGDDWATVKYPATSYAARKIAVGADNKPRLLWNRTGDNAATVWRLPVAGGSAAEVGVSYAAPTGYNLQSFAVGSTDNKVRLLWDQPAGKVAAWTLSAALTSIESGYTFGPLADGMGITTYNPASDIAVGSDNLIRLLWINPLDSTALVYNLTSTGTIGTQHSYAPTNGFTWLPVLDIGPASTDKKPRIVQTKGGIDNSIYYTSLKADLSVIDSSRLYHPANYAFVASSVGTDGKARILWERIDTNTFVIWQLSATGTIEATGSYGPLNNYLARSIAVGPTDNKVRLMWYGLDGKTAIWTLKADLSGTESAYVYGPYN